MAFPIADKSSSLARQADRTPSIQRCDVLVGSTAKSYSRCRPRAIRDFEMPRNGRQNHRQTQPRWSRKVNNCSGADLRATCNAALISSLMRFLQNQLLNPPNCNTTITNNKAKKMKKNKLLNDCFQSRDELMATFDHALPESETTKELKSFIAKQQETDVIRHVGRDLTLQGWDALGTRVEVYWSRTRFVGARYLRSIRRLCGTVRIRRRRRVDV